MWCLNVYQVLASGVNRAGVEQFVSIGSRKQGKVMPVSSLLVAECIPLGLAIYKPHVARSIACRNGASSDAVRRQSRCASLKSVNSKIEYAWVMLTFVYMLFSHSTS